jgi:hypothetical protein
MRFIPALSTFMMLIGSVIAVAQTVMTDDTTPLRSEGAESVPAGSMHYLPFPMPPHLEFEPDRVSSGGLDVAPMLCWYGDMPLVGTALHGVQTVDASGVGWSLGITSMHWINRLSGIQADVRYTSQHVEANPEVTISTQVQTDRNDTTAPPFAPVPARLHSSADYKLLQVTAAFHQEFAEMGQVRIALFMGPAFAYVVGTNRLESIELLEAAGPTRFFNPTALPTEEEGRRLILYNDKPPNSASTRLGIIAGLSFDLPLSHALSLVTSFEYEYTFSRNMDDVSEDPVNSLACRLSLVRHFF